MKQPRTILPAIPDEVARLAVEVLSAACAQGRRLVTAESCTGGLLAALLTDIEGCSHAFERGFVCYTDDAKAEVLGVARATLAIYGAVSTEAAAQMAAGALRHSRGDIAVSITGYAEPPPDGSDPAGLVFIGFADRTGPGEVEEHRFGDIGRGPVRIACLEAALRMLRRLPAGR